MENIRKKIDEERDRTVNGIFIAFTVAFFIMFVGLAFRFHRSDPLPIFSIYAPIFALIMGVTLLRKRISLRFKSFLLMGLILLIALGGTYLFGLMGGGLMVWLVIPIVMTLLFSIRESLLATLIASLLFVVFGFWVSKGGHTFTINEKEYQYAFSSWILLAVSYGAFTPVLVFIIHRMQVINSTMLETVERQRIELEEANSTKSKLFSVIAHDLRNPFVSIIGAIDSFINSGDEYSDQEKEAAMNSILDSSKHTNLLLENLLEWSLSQVNGLQIRKEELPLQKLINEVLQPYQRSAENKGIVIELRVDASVVVCADNHSLRIILSNLLNNAIKFTADGVIIITVEEEPRTTIIHVSDSGIGIPKGALKDLFTNKRFETTFGTNNEKGTGLGLGLCAELVQKNGGTIRVSSDEGVGTTFSVSLPRS